jgi:hypothetical protein
MRLYAVLVLAATVLVVGCVSSGCSIPGDNAWYVDSVKDGVVTVRHLNLVYKAASNALPQYGYESLVAAQVTGPTRLCLESGSQRVTKRVTVAKIKSRSFLTGSL